MYASVLVAINWLNKILKLKTTSFVKAFLNHFAKA